MQKALTDIYINMQKASKDFFKKLEKIFSLPRFLPSRWLGPGSVPSKCNVCVLQIFCNIFMCRYLKFWSIETIVKLKIQNCSTSSNEVHSGSIKDYEIAELFFRTGGVKSHLRCDCHVFRYLQPFCVTKSETCQMHLLQLLRKLTYCRDRSSSRYPCYSSRKPPGEGAMLSYNTICWTQSSKWNCFGIGISWRKVRWYTFEFRGPHYHVLRDIETISFPAKHFLPKQRQTITILTQILFRDKISFVSPKIIVKLIFEKIFFFSDWKNLETDMSHSAIGKVAFNSLLIKSMLKVSKYFLRV